MIPSYSAHEAEIIRDAVKEASARAKAHRERWAVGRKHLEGNDAGQAVSWQALVEGDAQDVFVETLALALFRAGGILFFP